MTFFPTRSGDPVGRPGRETRSGDFVGTPPQVRNIRDTRGAGPARVYKSLIHLRCTLISNFMTKRRTVYIQPMTPKAAGKK